VSDDVLKVVSLCAYLTNIQCKWRDDDFKARNLVKAIKGESFRGYSDVKDGRVTEDSRDPAFAWAARRFGRAIGKRYGDVDLILIPIPSSKSASQNDVKESAPFRLAKEAAGHLQKAIVAPYLWWESPQPSAHNEGGSRDPNDLYQHMVAKAGRRPETPTLLVDDVVTTASHLRVAARKLDELGVNVRAALVVGRQTDEQEDEPFKLVATEYTRLRRKGGRWV
jgi:hypothetical protein